jgi:hypothetical protein
MATFIKHTHKTGKVTWKCKARRKGFPTRTQTFDSKAEAQAWARQIESAMDSGEHSTNRKAESTTFADILEKYRDEVSPTHRGSENEIIRINATLRHPITKLSMSKLTPTVLAAWRDD